MLTKIRLAILVLTFLVALFLFSAPARGPTSELEEASSLDQKREESFENGAMIVPKYADLIIKYSLKFDLCPMWVATIIDLESTFRPQVINHSSGAIGLMQLLPLTAREVAGKLDEHSVAQKPLWELREFLMEPDNNIRYGTKYLKWCLDQASGSILEASAIYNAGYGRVREWKARGLDVSNPGELPFKETAHYLSRIKEATKQK